MALSKESLEQKQFRRSAKRMLPHHLTLSLTRIRLVRRYLNRSLEKYIQNDTLSYKTELLNRYMNVTKDSVLWHGTGRFQYQDGKITDTFQDILRDGGLKPLPDAYAIFSGGTFMNTISLTKSRIIARSYGDMHGKGNKEVHRYGSGFFWVSYYYGLFYAKLYVFNSMTLLKNWKKWYSLTHDKNKENTWGKKVNKNARDVWDAFAIGSDIKNNYPIIIGLRQLTNTVHLSRIFNKYEVRSDKPILFADWTHLEVPELYVNEIRKLLNEHGLNVPIFPIELGEKVASTKTVDELLNI